MDLTTEEQAYLLEMVADEFDVIGNDRAASRGIDLEVLMLKLEPEAPTEGESVAAQAERIKAVGGCGHVMGEGFTSCIYVAGHDPEFPHSDFGDWEDETPEQRAEFPYCAEAVALVDREMRLTSKPSGG